MPFLADVRELPTIDAAPFAFRAIRSSDIESLFGIFGDPEVMRYWSTSAFSGIQAAQAYFEEIQAGFDTRTLFQWGLVRAADDRVIGTGTLCNFNAAHHNGAVGYALARSEWGAGVMSRALPELIRFGFERLGLHRIEADVDPRNAASTRLLERIGFKEEGCRREAYFVNDEIQDAIMYGLLEREFKQRKADASV